MLRKLFSRERVVRPAVSAEEVLQFWQSTKPEMRNRPYVHTHAGRLAATINEVRALFAPQRMLDIAGNGVSQHLFKYFLEPEEYVCTPKKLDIELEDWGAHVPEEHFDLAMCTEVIEHMSADPARVLWQAHRALRFGGILLLTTPNICSYLGAFNLLHGRAPYHWGVLMGARGDRHHREYAPIELQELIAAQGFAVQVFTRDVYEHAEPHRTAREWITANIPTFNEALGGDTIFILAQKVDAQDEPVRLDPVYEAGVAIKRDDSLHAKLADLCRRPIEMGLLR